MGAGFFPLDEELGLQPGLSISPRQQEHLVHLASWMPFARAAQMMERLLGVQVSEATTRRLTEHAGALAEAVQTAQTRENAEAIPSTENEGRLAVSADGAYVPLLHGQWAEVRTVAIGVVEKDQTRDREHEVHVRHLSYFSRMTDAVTFADLAEVETRRRALSATQEVCAVTDGAEWLQGFLDLHCPHAVRILDFPHAAEHLSLLLQAVQQAGIALPSDLLERLCHRLKHRGPRLLVRLLKRLPAPLIQQQGIREQVGYLCKREALMQYPHYRKQGWPIGSGMVESANKVVVEARLKGAGMHWQACHVNPMLTLRNAVCNQRWQACWQEIGAEQARLRLLRRRRLATPRYQHLISSLMLLLLRFRPPAPTPVPSLPHPVPLAASLPGSWRPSPSHPWKRSFLPRKQKAANF